LRGRFPVFPESLVFFYELHEGDDDLFSDLLLAREEEMDPELFFDTVQSVRHRVQDTYEHDTLIEAIAEVLERDHGFIFVSDDRLTAAVNVSRDDEENFLADLESGAEALVLMRRRQPYVDDGDVWGIASHLEHELIGRLAAADDVDVARAEPSCRGGR